MGVRTITPTTDSTHRHPHHHNRERAYTLKRQAASAPGLPVGFDLSARPLPIHDLADFRIRRDDAQKLRRASQRGAGEAEGDGEGEEDGGGVGVDGVYFPLLATVLPKWRAVVHGGAALPPAPPLLVPPMPQQHPQVFKIVFLVSGVGMPRDPTSSATGNSTEGACVCGYMRGKVFFCSLVCWLVDRLGACLSA